MGCSGIQRFESRTQLFELNNKKDQLGQQRRAEKFNLLAANFDKTKTDNRKRMVRFEFWIWEKQQKEIEGESE